MCATSHGEQIRGEALPAWLEWMPEMPFDMMAEYSMDFWLQSEDLPRPENRISYDGEPVVLDVTEGNKEAAHRLKRKLEEPAGADRRASRLLERNLYLGKDIPIGGTAHQAGTARFGTDPRPRCSTSTARPTSSTIFMSPTPASFPSIGAVNPTLTIIANALRVADHIKTRLGA